MRVVGERTRPSPNRAPRVVEARPVAEVAITGLSRRYPGGNAAALLGLDLALASGELLVIVGPSGCGKSTTLRLVAGLDEPDAGDIRIAGRSMLGVPPQDRDVAMVFQGYALYPHMRAREILEFPLRMRGVAKAARVATVARVAELLGLGRLLDRRPGELSGGERQRVAMGRAIVREPSLFLFDEPLANLDAALRSELRSELGALVRRLGTTAMYVTHDHVEAMTLGDRIAVLCAGRLEQLGTPRELYERPATTFVAGFLGAPPMNLVDVAALAVAGLPAAVRTLGVRPEHVRLGDAADGEVALAGEVSAVEPLGAETHVTVDLGPSRVRLRVPGFDAPARGARVGLAVARDRLHAFDAEGRRVERAG